MPNTSSEIKIHPDDEVTMVGYKWLDEHGHGSRTTVYRKTKAGKFATPVEDGKWTLAAIKRYLNKKIKLRVSGDV
ncbi:MAG: hypothetical protein IIA77_04960 [Proteobacteria bacterium]|nr:hypothetical protein [Pseudomonadota bacterium]